MKMLGQFNDDLPGQYGCMSFCDLCCVLRTAVTIRVYAGYARLRFLGSLKRESLAWIPVGCHLEQKKVTGKYEYVFRTETSILIRFQGQVHFASLESWAGTSQDTDIGIANRLVILVLYAPTNLSLY